MIISIGIDYQQLQQFASSSPWKVEPVRRQIVKKAMEAIGPDAWVIDDTGFPKDGPASPGVARQYAGSLGKVGNVQIGVSVHGVTDHSSCPLDWRLFLPEKWDDTWVQTNEEAARIVSQRQAAQIPETVRHRPKWELAIEMLDEMSVWGHVPAVVVTDVGYGESGPFRTGLTDRGIDYVVQVKSSTSIHHADALFEKPSPTGKKGRPHSKASYQSAPVQAKDYAAQMPRTAFTEASWRQGSKATRTNHFAAVRDRPANRNLPRNPDGSLPACWLLIEWPPGAAEPTDYWLATLEEDTPITELVRLGKIRWRIEHDYRELKHGLGLDHFEGRTFTGWHHHVTLVSAAHLFITIQRLTADPQKPQGQPKLLPAADRAPSSNHPNAQLLPLLPTRRTHLTKYY
nr:IS701 family transposase [Nesterenkonia xinjiangensis]